MKVTVTHLLSVYSNCNPYEKWKHPIEEETVTKLLFMVINCNLVTFKK